MTTPSTQEQAEIAKHAEGGVASFEANLNEASPALGAVVNFVAGDAIELGKAGEALGKDPGSVGKWLGFLGAAAIFSLNFIPLGKVAGLACKALGRCLGATIAKKLFTETFEKALTNVACKAIDKEIGKGGEITIERLCEAQTTAISKFVESKVAPMVEKDVGRILDVMNDKFLSKDKLEKVLQKEIGMSRETAKEVTKKLIAGKVPQKMRGTLALSEMEKILTDEITAGMKDEFNEMIATGKFGKIFKEGVEKHLDDLADPMRQGGAKISKEVADGTKSKLDDVLREGVEDGITKGVKKGVKDAFDKFRKRRQLQMSADDSAVDANGMALMPSSAYLGGGASFAVGSTFRNIYQADRSTQRTMREQQKEAAAHGGSVQTADPHHDAASTGTGALSGLTPPAPSQAKGNNRSKPVGDE